MRAKTAIAATLLCSVFSGPTSAGKIAQYDVPVDAYQLGLIKPDDVIDLLITSRSQPDAPPRTVGFAQTTRVLTTSVAPPSFTGLSTDSGLIPSEVERALAGGGRVRLLLRGAGDHMHNTHIGALNSKTLQDYDRSRVPMEELLEAPTATDFSSLKSLRPLKRIQGLTVSGAQIPFGWRGFPLRLAPDQAAPKPGQRVDVTVSYSSGPLKTVSLWKKVPVLNVESESKSAIVWLTLPAGAARVLAYALDGLTPARVDLAVVVGE